MAQRANEELLKTLCEQAANEWDGEKLIALTNEIIALLDAEQKRKDAWKAVGKVAS